MRKKLASLLIVVMASCVFVGGLTVPAHAEDETAETGAAPMTFSKVQDKFVLDMGYSSTTISIKKNHALWDLAKKRKIIGGVKQAVCMEKGVLVLKTNGKLYYLYRKSAKKWTSRKLLGGVKELADGAYVEIGGKTFVYAVKKNGDLVKGTLKFNTSRSKVTKNTWKRVMKNTAHAYVANSYHTDFYDVSYYAIKKNGDLYAWGDNSYGQLGNGTFTKASKPVLVMGNVSKFSFAMQSNGTSPNGGPSCYAISSDGTLYGWGVNDFYTVQSGAGDKVKSPIAILENVYMAAGANHVAIALKNDGTLWTWGTELGNYSVSGMTVTHYAIGLTEVAQNVKAAVVNDFTMYFIKSDNTLWYKGSAPSTKYKASSEPVKLASKVTAVRTTNTDGMFFLKTNGYLYGVGYNFGKYTKKIKKLGTGFPK